MPPTPSQAESPDRSGGASAKEAIQQGSKTSKLPRGVLEQRQSEAGTDRIKVKTSKHADMGALRLEVETLTLAEPGTQYILNERTERALRSNTIFDLQFGTPGQGLRRVFDDLVLREVAHHAYRTHLRGNSLGQGLYSIKELLQFFATKLFLFLRTSRANPGGPGTKEAALLQLPSFARDEELLTPSRLNRIVAHLMLPPSTIQERISANMRKFVLAAVLYILDEKKLLYRGPAAAVVRVVHGEVVIWLTQLCVQCSDSSGPVVVHMRPHYHHDIQRGVVAELEAVAVASGSIALPTG